MSYSPIYEIIILGAGPAGISVAIEAIARGIKPSQILILEKSNEIIHMISKKYPEEKPVLANYKGKKVESAGVLSIGDMTKKDFVEFMRRTIVESKVDVQFNSTVNKIVKFKNGQLQVCTDGECFIGNSVFIAIGSMSSPRRLSVKTDNDALDKIYYDIQRIDKTMKDILVVGGGDSAAEYAMILKNRGHNVTLSYRGVDFTRMIEVNSVALTKMISSHEVTFYPRTEISTIITDKDILKVVLNNGEQGIYHAIVAALGTERPANYLEAIGIQLCYEGKEIYSESSLQGVFAVGDAASNAGGTINIAFNSGAKAFQEAFNFYLNHG